MGVEYTAYSYHTFILPLVWQSDKRNITFDDISSVFNNNPNWYMTDIRKDLSFAKGEDIVDFYNEYQYFYPQARRALYGYDKGIVRVYTFADSHVKNKAYYRICKNNNTYELLINAIRVIVYNTGIALFLIETENQGGKDGKSQMDFGSVKNINDYGRRITLPHIPGDAANSSCADSLEISIPELDKEFKVDFRKYIENVNSEEVREKKESLIRFNYMAGFVEEIINMGSMKLVSSDENDNSAFAYIRPALDDRMFVACAVSDPKTTESFLEKDEGKYAFEKGDDNGNKLSKSLYEFIFLDNDGGCTCQNDKMRNELLENHLYYRWLDYNSIYGIAAQSIVFLTNGGAPYLIGYFLTEYVRMACLCLAQRTSLVQFQQRLSKLSEETFREKRIKRASVTKLMSMQEAFSAFESQLLYAEITPQEQGIELYDMFQKYFFIEREKENVKSQLQGLYEASQTYLDFHFNLLGSLFAYIGALLAFIQIFTAVLPSSCRLIESDLHSLYKWGFLGGIIVVCSMIWLFFKVLYRRR